MKILLPALFLVFLLSSVLSSSPPPRSFEIGQAFPDMILPSLEDGRPISIAQFRGKKVLLHVFASW